jgi:hypothetical protein
MKKRLQALDRALTRTEAAIFRAIRWALHNWDKLLPAVAVVLMVVIFFGQKAIVDREHDAAVETCERTNDARVASVKEKRQSVRSLSKQLDFWEAATEASKGQEPSPLMPVFLTFVGGLREELTTKREGIRQAIESQAPVAIAPGSPVVDCTKATS